MLLFPVTVRCFSANLSLSAFPKVSGASNLRALHTVVRSTQLMPSLTASTVGTIQIQQRQNFSDVKKSVDKYRKGDFETVPDPSNLAHFKTSKAAATAKTAVPVEKKDHEEGYNLPHPIWTEEQLHDVHITHKKPESFVDSLAYWSVKALRGGFDIFSGFKFGQRNEKKWLTRVIFLETVAGVPGMVAAMMRHMKSLRRMQRDQGWIHTLLEEAENERMHLLTALQLKQPSLLFRVLVICSQGVFVTMFGMCYVISPRFCHRFVGYLEEEAVITYTKCLKDIKDGNLKHWQTQKAPEIAIQYWKLKKDATIQDVILAIRADEAHHRLVNHSLASLKKDEFNPYKPGE